VIVDVSSSPAQKNIDLRPSPPSAGTVTLPKAPPPPPQKAPEVKVGPGLVVAPKAPPLGNPGNNITIAPSMIQPQMPPGTPNPPQNPSQKAPPSVPGLTVTIPIKP
jgi:neural Wiskott-Aldrich syndrome protein